MRFTGTSFGYSTFYQAESKMPNMQEYAWVVPALAFAITFVTVFWISLAKADANNGKLDQKVDLVLRDIDRLLDLLTKIDEQLGAKRKVNLGDDGEIKHAFLTEDEQTEMRHLR